MGTTSSTNKALKSFVDFQTSFMDCTISTPLKLYSSLFKVLVLNRYNFDVDDLYQFFLYDSNRKYNSSKKSALYRKFDVFFKQCKDREFHLVFFHSPSNINISITFILSENCPDFTSTLLDSFCREASKGLLTLPPHYLCPRFIFKSINCSIL